MTSVKNRALPCLRSKRASAWFRLPGSGGGGFTLLELVIVMILIFTFTAVVAPRFSDFVPALRVKRSGEELLAACRKARADAALKGRIHRVNVDPESRTWWLMQQGDPFREPEMFKALKGEWAGAVELPTGVEAAMTREGEEKYLEFFPDGTATEGSVELSNTKGDRITVRVIGTTGRVYVEEEK